MEKSKEFDYVIVGAGSAGCVLANRLTSRPEIRVLLLEAGGRDNDIHIQMPGSALKLLPSRRHNWYYTTEPQTHAGNRSLYWPRGKVLGGSSSINVLLYIRGHVSDYDAWAAAGNPGWAFDDVLPYFKRSEGRIPPESKWHGTEGPLRVAPSEMHSPLAQAFLEAGQSAGHPTTTDFNGPSQEGIGIYDKNIHQGQRYSSAVAFLRPALKRENLLVELDAHVLKINFNGPRAVGVTYFKRGKLVDALAAREVVLSGGTVNTPHLLMLSGVGSSAALRKLGIEVKVNLPGVGRNLQDHLDCSIQTECKLPVSDFKFAGPFASTMIRAQWQMFRTGPGARISIDGGAFLRSSATGNRPDLQYHFCPGLLYDHGRKATDRHGYTLRFCLLRPKSAGWIALRSADPYNAPMIQPNYLCDSVDLKPLRNGVRQARDILAQPAFEQFRGKELSPGLPVSTDAEIDDWIRGNAESIYHPVGTCRMGNDESAVVDSALRVRGLEGLRIVDASIMPSIIGGNTNAPTIMIAERAADLIQRESKTARFD